MDVQPMDLDEAETLARAGAAGRVSTALFRELERVRAAIGSVGDELGDGTCCSFFACPGPDEPVVPMATCKVCAAAIELRTLLGGDQ